MKQGLNFSLILFFCTLMYSCNPENSGETAEERGIETVLPVPKNEIQIQAIEAVPYPDAMVDMYSPLGNEHFNPGKVPFEFNIKNHPFGADRPLKLSINGGEALEVDVAHFRREFNPGAYRAVAYLIDENGLALKEYGNFVDRDFTVGDSRPFPPDDEPYFIVNLPRDGQEYKADEKVLVDWLYLGGDLLDDGVIFNLMVGDTTFQINSLNPVVLNGLNPGAYEVVISLRNREGEALSGIFTSYKRKIQIN